QAQKLPSKVTFVCLLHMSISGLRYFCKDLIRSKYLYVLFLKVRQELTYKLGNNLLIQQHGIQSIANRWPRDLGIRYDGRSFIEISCLVDVVWHTPAPVSMTGTFAFWRTKSISDCEPRGIMISTTAVAVNKSCTYALSVGNNCTICGSVPTASR